MYIYLYIERERCMYIYIYIYVLVINRAPATEPGTLPGHVHAGHGAQPGARYV